MNIISFNLTFIKYFFCKALKLKELGNNTNFVFCNFNV